MSLTAGGTAHAIGTTPLASDGPFSIFGWFNPTSVGQFRRFFQIGNSGDDNQFNLIGTDTASASGQAIAATFQTSSSGTQTKGATLSTGTWYFLGATFASNGQPGLVVNQNAKTVGGTGFNPTINQTLVNGRPSNFANGAVGQFAHLGGVTRILSDLELSYLGGGGNTRWLNYARYWKCAASETTTITDASGTENLTCTSITAGTTDPVIATYWTATALGNQSYTQGSAISSIDLTTKFDQVAASVDYTGKLFQLGTPGTPTTATAGGTSSNLITVSSATGFSAGNYCSITNSTTPVLILAISGSTLLLGAFKTWSANDSVYPITATQKTFTFYSSGNTFSGTPAAGDVGTYNNCFFRAANNTTATLIADSPLFSITIASSGAAPSFSAGPTLTSANTDGYTFSATSNQTATWYLVAMFKGSTAPTAAQVKSGSPTGFVNRWSAALTLNVAGTLSATGLTLPVYDLYMVVDNGSGTSSVVTFADQLKSAGTTKQYVRATVVSVSAVSKANPVQITTSGAHGRTTGDWIDVYGLGGMTELNTAFAAGVQQCTVVDSTHLTVPIDSTGFTSYTSGGSLAWGASIDRGASTAIATGDVRVLDLVTGPDGCAVSCRPDGSISIAMGSVTRRQSFVVDAYSVSGQAMLGPATEYFQNQPPVVPGVAGTVLPPIFLPANQTITAVHISTFATSPELDNLSVQASGLPSGLSISSGDLVGTTAGNSITATTFTWTDAAGETASANYNVVIGNVSPPNLFGLTQDTIVALLSAYYLSATFSGGQDNTAGVGGAPAPVGTAIAQNPPFGTAVPPTSTINVSLSSGNAPQVITPPTPTGLKSAQLQYEESAGTVNAYREDEVFGALVLGAGDPAGQVYRIGRIPASARATALQVMNDPNGTGSLYRIGVAFANNGGLVVPGSDAILLPSFTLDTARPTWVEMFAPAVVGQPSSLSNVGRRIWELLGMSQDPSPPNKDQYYDVILTAVSPGASGGAVNVRVLGRLISSLRVP